MQWLAWRIISYSGIVVDTYCGGPDNVESLTYGVCGNGNAFVLENV